MRETSGRNAKQVEAARKFASEKNVDLRTAALDVSSQESADRAVRQVLSEAGQLDVVIHYAGHMVFGPAEAFTPEQLAELYDVNVLSTQRVNRAALPILRKQGRGLVVWVGSSSTRGGTPPYLAPYFAAKAGMDAMAVSYAGELARWNIETTIIVPGAFTSGTNHFANAGKPDDGSRAAEYASGPTATLGDEIMKGFARTAAPDADATEVAHAIVRVVDVPFGKRPFRVHIDPASDGAEVVNAVADRVRVELLRNMGWPICSIQIRAARHYWSKGTMAGWCEGSQAVASLMSNFLLIEHHAAALIMGFWQIVRSRESKTNRLASKP